MRFTSKGSPALAIIGPSGAGKSTVIRRLHDEGIIIVNPTWTTRPPRPGESEESIEHHFVSEIGFKKKERTGYFVEVVKMFGLPYRYGLPAIAKSTPDKISLVMLRVSLLSLFNKHYPDNIVYQIEDELPRIRERLIARQLHGEELGSRLDDYEKEVKAGRKAAKRIFVNNDVEALARKIEQALMEDFS